MLIGYFWKKTLLFLSCDRSMAPIKTNDTSNERELTEVLYFHAWNTMSVRWHPLWATQERARESTPSITLSSVAATILPISSVILCFSSASVWRLAANTSSFTNPQRKNSGAIRPFWLLSHDIHFENKARLPERARKQSISFLWLDAVLWGYDKYPPGANPMHKKLWFI